MRTMQKNTPLGKKNSILQQYKMLSKNNSMATIIEKTIPYVVLKKEKKPDFIINSS